MDSVSAFEKGEANRGKEAMVFDWDKAATLIKESGSKNARAGLCSDWEWTGGDILEDGKIPDESYCYLASTWATPEIEINGEVYDCFKMEGDTDGWGAGTFWPESARKILGI
jgi:hypothetical protein